MPRFLCACEVFTYDQSIRVSSSVLNRNKSTSPYPSGIKIQGEMETKNVAGLRVINAACQVHQ